MAAIVVVVGLAVCVLELVGATSAIFNNESTDLLWWVRVKMIGYRSFSKTRTKLA